MEEAKQCTKCKQWKTLDQFAPGKHWCHNCRRAYMREYRKRPAVIKKKRAENKLYARRNKDKLKEYNRQYYRDHTIPKRKARQDSAKKQQQHSQTDE